MTAISTGLSALSALPARAELLVDLVARSAPRFPVIERYDDWLLVCHEGEPARQCQGQPAQPDRKSGAPVALTIVPGSDGKDPVLLLRAPLEVLLSFGIELKVDGRSVGRLGFQLCDRSGCLAPTPFSGQIATSLSRGRLAELTVRDRQGTDQHSLQSLIGLTKMLTQMAKSGE